jgi:hypothetical protein
VPISATARFLARNRRAPLAKLKPQERTRDSRFAPNATLRLNWMITVVATALAAVSADAPVLAWSVSGEVSGEKPARATCDTETTKR